MDNPFALHPDWRLTGLQDNYVAAHLFSDRISFSVSQSKEDNPHWTVITEIVGCQTRTSERASDRWAGSRIDLTDTEDVPQSG
jgi:hypothetical protein